MCTYSTKEQSSVQIKYNVHHTQRRNDPYCQPAILPYACTAIC